MWVWTRKAKDRSAALDQAQTQLGEDGAKIGISDAERTLPGVAELGRFKDRPVVNVVAEARTVADSSVGWFAGRASALVHESGDLLSKAPWCIQADRGTIQIVEAVVEEANSELGAEILDGAAVAYVGIFADDGGSANCSIPQPATGDQPGELVR